MYTTLTGNISRGNVNTLDSKKYRKSYRGGNSCIEFGTKFQKYKMADAILTVYLAVTTFRRKKNNSPNLAVLRVSATVADIQKKIRK